MPKYHAKVIFDANKASDLFKLVDKVYDLDRWDGLPMPPKSVSFAHKKRLNYKRTISRRGDKVFKSTAEVILRGILADGKVHHTNELTEALMKEGYAKNSMSPRLSILVNKGEVKLLGDGNYKLSKLKPSIEDRVNKRLGEQAEKNGAV